MCIIEIIILIDPLHLVPGADEVPRYLSQINQPEGQAYAFVTLI